MGCIRVEKITEYLCDPLQRTLTDEDPYVEDRGDLRREAARHQPRARGGARRSWTSSASSWRTANPMVVANAVAALTEIQDASAGDP